MLFSLLSRSFVRYLALARLCVRLPMRVCACMCVVCGYTQTPSQTLPLISEEVVEVSANGSRAWCSGGSLYGSSSMALPLEPFLAEASCWHGSDGAYSVASPPESPALCRLCSSTLRTPAFHGSSNLGSVLECILWYPRKYFALLLGFRFFPAWLCFFRFARFRCLSLLKYGG